MSTYFNKQWSNWQIRTTCWSQQARK